MILRRRKSKKARATEALRELAAGRRKSTPARITDSVRKKVKRSGPATTVQGAGGAGKAAGRGGKAVAVYAGRKTAGKRMPLLVGVPAFAGASIAGFMAVRKMRRGVKQTAPAP